MADSNRKITTSLSEWDFQTQHVQNNLTGGDFVGSHGCVLCATVPRLEDLSEGAETALTNEVGDESAANDLGRSIAIPIGVIDTATIQQNRQVAQIFELGSKRSYILSARTVSQMSLARVFYKGASLLRMLYAYYPSSVKGEENEVISEDYGNILRDNTKDVGTSMGGNPIAMDSWLKSRLPVIQDNPGYNNVWFNLASDVFSQPCGLILFMKDNNKSDVAAVFLEECNVQTHGLSISANSVVLAENTSIMFERIVPIKVKIDEYADAGTEVSGVLNDGALPIA